MPLEQGEELEEVEGINVGNAQVISGNSVGVEQGKGTVRGRDGF